MPDQGDPEVLQILGRKARQHRAVDRIFAERRLVLGEPETPQPFCDIHRPLSLRPIIIPKPPARTRVNLITVARDIRRQQYGNRGAAPGATPFKRAAGSAFPQKAAT
jgi:hypothetical protein